MMKQQGCATRRSLTSVLQTLRRTGVVYGIIVVILGIVVYAFAPAGPLFPQPFNAQTHATQHMVAGALLAIAGVAAIPIFKKGKGLALGVVVLILGVLAYLIVPGILSTRANHLMNHQIVSAVTVIVGLAAIAVLRKT